jgi:hypothetical protein
MNVTKAHCVTLKGESDYGNRRSKKTNFVNLDISFAKKLRHILNLRQMNTEHMTR